MKKPISYGFYLDRITLFLMKKYHSDVQYVVYDLKLNPSILVLRLVLMLLLYSEISFVLCRMKKEDEKKYKLRFIIIKKNRRFYNYAT